MTNASAARHGDASLDWLFIRSICHDTEQDLPAIVASIVRDIRPDLPEYAVVPVAEHEQTVQQELRGLLHGLASRRLPGTIESSHARQLGRRRAEQGIPVEAVLGAYHIGYRELWNILLSRARSENPAQAEHLLAIVNLTWSWLRTLTGAAADGYAEAVRAREVGRTRQGHQLLEALYSGRVTAESTEPLARALAFDPRRDFQAICCPEAMWSLEGLDGLRRRLRGSTVPGSIVPGGAVPGGAAPGSTGHGTTGACIAITRGPTLVILFQQILADQILKLLSDGTRTLVAGVGLPRSGLAGAAASIADAEQALTLAQRQGRVVRFDADWLAATLQPHLGRLQPLIGAAPTALQPHLSEAVLAYAGHRFSVTASAQSLGVHPNTVKYRMDRWQQLTGWDPRTLDGLLRSVLSIALTAAPEDDRPQPQR
jgi:hypothetical protein